MLRFECDYICGAHPRILERLAETNMEGLSGYGADPYTRSAAEKIRAACGCPEADVHLLSGGTQTNKVVIGTVLRPWQGVIAANTGHVSLHEAGAIEATGHKVLQIPAIRGKISADQVENYLETFYADVNAPHMVEPGMVYISHPTEYGTLYTKAELSALHAVCRRYEIPLFIDGARLGYGLMSLQSDMDLPALAGLCDVFYIGGTKVGALCGEAVVFPRGNAPAHFFTMIKQYGALMAKGRLLSVQFDTLFTDDLYFKISRHAIDMAELLKQVLREKGYSFFLDSPTNQQFVVLDNDQVAALQDKAGFEYWERIDETRNVVRFATSWSTTEADIAALKEIL